jgi:hypothetical protein
MNLDETIHSMSDGLERSVAPPSPYGPDGMYVPIELSGTRYKSVEEARRALVDFSLGYPRASSPDKQAAFKALQQLELTTRRVADERLAYEEGRRRERYKRLPMASRTPDARESARNWTCGITAIVVVAAWFTTANVWNAEWKVEASVSLVLLTIIGVASGCFEGWIRGH